MTYPHWDDDATAAWHQHQLEQQHYIETERNKRMKLSELVPSTSRYLGKDDVGTAGLNLTVKHFKREEVKSDNGSEPKVVVYWVEDVKPMILNKTNSQLLEVVTGADDTEGVKGKVVNVYHDRTIAFGGKIVGGLRIREATGAPADVRSADGDEDIPF